MAEQNDPPPRRRSGRKRRTRPEVIPDIPVNEFGKRARPKAIEDDLTIDNVDFYKKSDCRYYTGCLDHVAKMGWDQFSCRLCNIYVRNPEIDAEFEEIVSRLDRIDFTD